MVVTDSALESPHLDEKSADFYTIGYAGRSITEFVSTLIAVGVTTLIDIRSVAASRYKPEFSKTNLRNALEAHSIDYVHLPELGVPRDIRVGPIAEGMREKIWLWYDKHVAMGVSRNLHTLLNVAPNLPVALMCVESDPETCHRHRLTIVLGRAGFSSYDL